MSNPFETVIRDYPLTFDSFGKQNGQYVLLDVLSRVCESDPMSLPEGALQYTDPYAEVFRQLKKYAKDTDFVRDMRRALNSKVPSCYPV